MSNTILKCTILRNLSLKTIALLDKKMLHYLKKGIKYKYMLRYSVNNKRKEKAWEYRFTS